MVEIVKEGDEPLQRSAARRRLQGPDGDQAESSPRFASVSFFWETRY